MAASLSCLSNLACKFPMQIQCRSQAPEPMFSLLRSFFVVTFSLFIFSFSVFKKLRKTEQNQQTQNDLFELQRSLSETLGKTHLPHENNQTQFANQPRKLLVEILPSDSPKWASLFEGGDPDSAGSVLDEERVGSGGHQSVMMKKKKRRAKKKSSSSNFQEEEEDVRGKVNPGPGLGSPVKEDLVRFYPFTSSSSGTQRKIKQQYDELMKRHESKKLTLAQG